MMFVFGVYGGFFLGVFYYVFSGSKLWGKGFGSWGLGGLCLVFLLLCVVSIVVECF